MIDFRCFCGEALSVPADQAGGLVQCPQCRRLVDVPLPGQEKAYEPDGTYHVETQPAPPPKPVVLPPPPLFQPGQPQPAISSAPMRQAAAPAVGVPAPAGSSAASAAIPLPRPQYDPETGELIRPMELQPVPVGKSLPPSVAAPPVLSYGTDATSYPRSIALQLLMVANLLVMTFALLFTMIASLRVAGGGFSLVSLLPMLSTLLLLAHYGSVIDEIGPEGKDELPRPLRDVSWTDDFVNPLFQVSVSLLVCVAPSMLVSGAGQVFLLAAGLVILPAFLLTLATSGSVLNLRPDRLVGVMRICASAYIIAALWGAAAVLLYFGYATGLIYHLASPRGATGFTFLIKFRAIELVLAVYAAHYFCWYLGMLYRQHAVQFPWVLQRHERPAAAPPTRAVHPPGQSGH